jgi:hypothetical protein
VGIDEQVLESLQAFVAGLGAESGRKDVVGAGLVIKLEIGLGEGMGKGRGTGSGAMTGIESGLGL